MNPLVSFPISSSISLSFPPPVYLSVVYYPSNGLSIISYRKYSPKLLSSPCNCSSFPKQSIKVYILVVTCSQIKSLHPSRLLQAGGHRFKCEKLQLSASQGKCEENIYGLIAKKKNVYSFDDIVVVLWCSKTFFWHCVIKMLQLCRFYLYLQSFWRSYKANRRIRSGPINQCFNFSFLWEAIFYSHSIQGVKTGGE